MGCDLRPAPILAVVTVLSLVARPAVAEPSSPSPRTNDAALANARTLLRRGIALYRESSFAASVAALEQARAAAPLEPPEHAECGFYIAADYLALGSPGPAREELRRVIRSLPDYEAPPFTSPKVAALLQEVRLEGERAPRLRPLPPRRVGPESLELRFEAARTGGRVYGAVSYRLRGEPTFREVPLVPAGERLVAQLPVAQSGVLEYYADAIGPAGAMRTGSAVAPLEVAVRGLSPAVVTSRRRRALWVAAGVGAAALIGAGLGLGLYYGLRSSPASQTTDVALSFQPR
jgi:hypothetical protein